MTCLLPRVLDGLIRTSSVARVVPSALVHQILWRILAFATWVVWAPFLHLVQTDSHIFLLTACALRRIARVMYARILRLSRPFVMVTLMLKRRIFAHILFALVYQLLFFQLHLVVKMYFFRPAHLPHFRSNVYIRQPSLPTPSTVVFVRLYILHPFVVTMGEGHLFLLPLAGSDHTAITWLVLRFVLACLGVSARSDVALGGQVANENIVKVSNSRTRWVEFACLAWVVIGVMVLVTAERMLLLATRMLEHFVRRNFLYTVWKQLVSIHFHASTLFIWAHEPCWIDDVWTIIKTIVIDVIMIFALWRSTATVISVSYKEVSTSFGSRCRSRLVGKAVVRTCEFQAALVIWVGCRGNFVHHRCIVCQVPSQTLLIALSLLRWCRWESVEWRILIISLFICGMSGLLHLGLFAQKVPYVIRPMLLQLFLQALQVFMAS